MKINNIFNTDTHYIVTKGSACNEIISGDTLMIRQEKWGEGSSLGEYALFLPPREDAKGFFGMSAQHTVLYFDTIDELSAKLNGVEVKYDLNIAQLIIDKKEKEIKLIKERHGIE
jgi:hypothetical protein